MNQRFLREQEKKISKKALLQIIPQNSKHFTLPYIEAILFHLEDYFQSFISKTNYALMLSWSL